MFYSETLLSKTGPLARVWLSSNLERKVPKSQILQQNIEDTVDTIVSQDQAPLALRLTGQLLLGVVRIYSRKARYLLDDCNDALVKIKMAFRPGNVDLPANMLNANTAEKHILTDTVTGIDLRLPADPDILFAELTFPTASGTVKNQHLAHKQNITLDDGDYLVNPSQLEIGRGSTQLGIQNGAGMDIDENQGLVLQDDLGLDIGDDDGFGFDMGDTGMSLEVGRDAPVIQDDLFSPVADRRDGDGDTTMGNGEADKTLDSGAGGDDFGFMGDDTDILLQPDVAPQLEENGIIQGDEENRPGTAADKEIRDDESELTHIDELERALEVSEFQPLHVPDEEHDEDMPKREPKRRKIIIDKATEIRGKNLKAQQDDRTNILRDQQLLPRDPTMLTLTLLQKSGGFASSVFYPKNIHPDLAKLVDPDFFKEIADKKRKRTLGLEAPDAGDGPSLHIPDDEDHVLGEDGQQDITLHAPTGDEDIVHIPGDDFDHGALGLDDTIDNSIGGGAFGFNESGVRDGSATPIPEDAQPTKEVVSQATTHAVHLLREQFEEPSGRSNLTKTEVVFQNLFPRDVTTKADATKMFFEVLVLATKDAVNVRQDHVKDEGRIRIKGKKALWGAWAEHGGDEKEGEMGGVAVGIQPSQQAVQAAA